MKVIKEEYEKIILERRIFESKIQKAVGNNHIKEKIENFNHFVSLIESTILGVSNVNSLFKQNYEKTIEPYHFLMKTTIAFNLRFYDSLCLKMKDSPFFPWETKRNQDFDIFLLLLWKENIHSIITAYSLFLKNYKYQAMQLLRSYIESSAILYLSLVDIDFLSEYANNTYSKEEYMKLWFKKLKPNKVIKKITNLHNRWESENKKIMQKIIGHRSQSDNVILSEFTQNIYSLTSDYMHFNSKVLYSNSYFNKINKLYIGLENKSVVNSMEISMFIELFSNTSNLLETAVRPHKKIIDYIGIMGDFSELNFSLQLRCGYFRGMYNLSEEINKEKESHK